MKYEYFGIIATAPSGSTAAMELVSGRERAAKVAEDYIESDHTVRVFLCKEIDYDIVTTKTIMFNSNRY